MATLDTPNRMAIMKALPPRLTRRKASGGVIYFQGRVATMKTRKRTPRVAEMRDEYDFSHGVRGKYAGRAGGAMIPGVQFLVDEAGVKTAVVIDLRENSELWEDFYDRALARLRRREPRESLPQVKARLRPRRRRPARA